VGKATRLAAQLVESRIGFGEDDPVIDRRVHFYEQERRHYASHQGQGIPCPRSSVI